MNIIKSMVLLCTVLVTACNSAGVKSDAAAPVEAAAPATAAPNSTAPKTSAPVESQQAAEPVAQGASSKQIELIANRVTAVQDHLLQLKAQNSELQLQSQSVLQNLSGLKQDIETLAASSLEKPEATEPSEPVDPAALNSVLDQITMMANELGTQVQDGAYRVVTSYTAKGQWVLIRFHRYTGETWLADQNQWHPLEELVETSTSEYEVVLLRADKDVKGYVAARIDRLSGETWWLKQNTWQSFIP